MTAYNGIRAKTVFLSDLHLGSKDCQAEKLLKLLEHLECEELYLLGDIVDFWSLSKRIYWPPSHYEVIKTLVKMAQSGTRVVYIPGNHDVPMREYSDSLLMNVEIKEEAVYTMPNGKKYLLFHGDILDERIRFGWLCKFFGDIGYPLLLKLNRWFSVISNRLGYDYWSLSSYLKTRSKKAVESIEIYEIAAAAEARRRGLDGVICGHIHQPNVRNIDGIHYCNDGDWVENCTILVEHYDGTLALLDCSNLFRKRHFEQVSEAA